MITLARRVPLDTVNQARGSFIKVFEVGAQIKSLIDITGTSGRHGKVLKENIKCYTIEILNQGRQTLKSKGKIIIK